MVSRSYREPQSKVGILYYRSRTFFQGWGAELPGLGVAQALAELAADELRERFASIDLLLHP